MRIVVVCFMLICSSFVSYAEQEPKVFQPYAELRLGLVATDLTAYTEYKDYGGDESRISDVYIGGSLLYHFTDKWAMSFQLGPELSNCILCWQPKELSDGRLTSSHYSAHLYHLEAVYKHQLSSNWVVLFDTGFSLGQEVIKTTTCEPEPAGMLDIFGPTCDREAGFEESEEKTNKLGVIAGVALQYIISENWSTQLGYKVGSYRKKFMQTSLSLSYHF